MRFVVPIASRLVGIVVALAALAAGEACAQLPDGPEAFGVALRSWARNHDIDHGLIVVRREGRIVHRSALGGADPNAPVHLASLSKAITGACVATLVRDGKLTFETPVASALAKFMARAGGDGDPRLRRVTVAQLLTHRAGYGTRKDDPGSGPALMDYLRTNPANARPSPAFLSWAIQQKLADEPGSKFVYSNTGYLALGAIIEEATAQRYAPYCRQAVLAPLGLAGDLEPSWRVMWSFGGWRMAAADYLAFLDVFDSGDARLGNAAKSWMLDSAGKGAGGESWYGLGTYVRKSDTGVNLRHFGSWFYKGAGLNAGSGTSFLTLAARQSDGTAWFVYVSPRPPRDEEQRPGPELERALLDAYRGIKIWN